jgi:cytochrome P450
MTRPVVRPKGRETVPTSDVDLYGGRTLLDPNQEYRALRDAGPVVWLERFNVYAVSRYDDARWVLGDPDTFCSGQGVGLNEFANLGGLEITLLQDGDTHTRFRKVIGQPMTPKALAELRPSLQNIANDLADRLVSLGSFDAVTDLAEVIPSTWVPDLLGWPEQGREHLLRWGADTFDAGGPLNERCLAAGPGVVEMIEYANEVATNHHFPVGTMGAGVLAAAARGDIKPDQCPGLLVDYLGPSLDTTISALGSAIWLFGTHPDQWDLLRREPNRARNAFNEVLRLESPITGFTRVATRDADIGGTTVPAGSRLLVLYASANRDERRWERPDDFDITRDASGQIAFGYGVHLCVGMGLARLEGAAILEALIPRVERFEIGEVTRRPNNLIRAFATIATTVHPARPHPVTSGSTTS